jgi:hypothetical protein
MALPAALYAIPQRATHALKREVAPPAAIRHRDIGAIRTEKMAELRAKKAIDRACILLTRLEERQAQIDLEIAALQKRKKRAVERFERIGDAIIAELEGAGLTRADGFASNVSISPSPSAVNVFDAGLLPELFWRQPKSPAKAPDKMLIKQSLERRESVPGAKLVQGVTLRRG